MPPVTPTVPASPTAVASGPSQVVQDARQLCEVTLPAGFGPAGAAGTFATADGRMRLTLQSLDVSAAETLDDVALPFVGTFIPTVPGYQQTTVMRLADSLRIDFTGGSPQPGAGTIYLRQFGTTACALTFFSAAGAGAAYDAMVDALLPTLRPKGVG